MRRTVVRSILQRILSIPLLYKVLLANGFNWLRYRVLFDNGVEIGDRLSKVSPAFSAVRAAGGTVSEPRSRRRHQGCGYDSGAAWRAGAPRPSGGACPLRNPGASLPAAPATERDARAMRERAMRERGALSDRLVGRGSPAKGDPVPG